MKKNILYKKTIFIFLTCIILIFTSGVFALNLPVPSQRLYINDFADIFSDENEDYIFANSYELNKETGAQLVVVSVDSLDDLSIEEYSYELASKWGIGKQGDDTGCMILIAPNERKIRVEVGYGLEGRLNDGKVGEYIRKYATPLLKENNFNSGIINLYNAILPEIYEEFGLKVPENIVSPQALQSDMPSGRREKTSVFAAIIIILVIFGIIGRGNGGFLPFVILSNIFGRGGRGGGFGGFGGSGGGFDAGDFGGGDFGGGGASGDF